MALVSGREKERWDGQDKPPLHDKPRAATRSSKSRKILWESSKTMPDSPSGGLITATIDTATGKIINVRSIDDAGASIELTTDRRASLSEQIGEASLEDLFEQAFEAGIASVLGDDDEADADAELSESEDDVALRHQILQPMIEHSAARRLMRQEILGRAIVGTLIRKAAAGAPDIAAAARSSSAA
jgi:hypothetical protein